MGEVTGKFRIRSWKSLEEEFEKDNYGEIYLGNCYFNSKMKELCDTKIKVRFIGKEAKSTSEGAKWYITEDMIIEEDRKKFRKKSKKALKCRLK